jgi:hypothetical protein
MHEQEEKKVADLLKQSLTPANPDLHRDLWPQMLRRLDQRTTQRHWFAAILARPGLSAVPWFDWALLAVLVLGICAFPRSIPIWLYHF